MTTPFPKKLRHSLAHLAVIVRHDPIGKDGIPLTHIALVDRNVNCLALPNQDHFRLRSSHCCVKQIPTQHDIVLLQQRHNDDWIFLSLTLMDR